MDVRRHLAGSAAASAVVYAATGSALAGASCAAAGILIDLDHLLDYAVQARGRFSPRAFLDWCYGCAGERYYLALHSYELLAVLALWCWLSPNPAAVGVAVGAGLHLAMDQYGNRVVGPGLRMSQGFYFLAWRALRGFRKDELLFG